MSVLYKKLFGQHAVGPSTYVIALASDPLNCYYYNNDITIEY